MIVILGETFKKHFVNFPRQDRIKIFEFIEHIKQYGFDGLKCLNKASHNIPKDHPNWSE